MCFQGILHLQRFRIVGISRRAKHRPSRCSKVAGFDGVLRRTKVFFKYLFCVANVLVNSVQYRKAIHYLPGIVFCLEQPDNSQAVGVRFFKAVVFSEIKGELPEEILYRTSPSEFLIFIAATFLLNSFDCIEERYRSAASSLWFKKRCAILWHDTKGSCAQF